MPIRHFILLGVAFLCSGRAFCFSGPEGGTFLDIPVGARPAAMGSAYSALATDAYGMVYNPGGLGFAPQMEIAAQHLAYLESIHYESLSAVLPLKRLGSFGGAIQYLGSGQMSRTDRTGNRLGDFSSHYAAYSLGYSRRLQKSFSVGMTGKMIEGKIADVRANAYAFDLGLLAKPTSKINIGLVAANWGSALRFIDSADRLPRSIRGGVAMAPTSRLLLSAEGAYRPGAPWSGHVGAEWRPVKGIALRSGYRTDTLKQLGAIAGFSAGLGITLWNQELAYAWVPYGDLGTSQYLSFVARLGGEDTARRNLASRFVQQIEQPVTPNPEYRYDYSDTTLDETLPSLTSLAATREATR